MPETTVASEQACDASAALLFEQASACQASGDYLSALSLLAELISKYPRLSALQLKQGTIFWAAKKYQDALNSFDRAIALDSGNAEAHFCKATALQSLDYTTLALDCYDKALAIQPDYVEALNNKAVLLKEAGHIQEAIHTYNLAIRTRPDCTQAWVGKSLCELLLGDFASGWRSYEWRKRKFGPLGQPSKAPMWQGEPLADKTLLIQAEQGLGDTIQFCRYAKIARSSGANVIMQIPDRLLRLLGKLDPTITLIGISDPTPACDYQTMLLSMPGIYWNTYLPRLGGTAYLLPDPQLVSLWRERIGNSGFKVGIHWQGEKAWEGIDKASDRERSFPIIQFRRISQLPGVRLISLQKNDGLEQLKELPPGMRVEEPGYGFDDGPDAFIDSAAIIANLDLVITSDTALAHLAGALGCEVWVALQYVPDWRWQLGRRDTIWYPKTRLFRQPSRGAWREVFDEMQRELTPLASEWLMS